MQIIRKDFPRATKQVVIAPLGDIQWTGRREDVAYDALKRHIDHALKMDAWFVGTGDYIDFLSPSNRTRLKSAALYDTAEAVIDDAAMELVRSLYDEILKPTTGRWLGMLEGHHFTTLTTGDTTDHRLCQLLKAPFLGTTAYIGLGFLTPDGVRVVTLWAHHGFGSGQKVHSPILKLENLVSAWDADVFLMGHHSKVGAAPINRVYPVWRTKSVPTFKSRAIRLVGCGAWFKAYVKDAKAGRHYRGNYVEQKGLNPVALGAPLIVIQPQTNYEADRHTRARPRPPGQKNGSRLWDPVIRVVV